MLKTKQFRVINDKFKRTLDTEINKWLEEVNLDASAIKDIKYSSIKTTEHDSYYGDDTTYIIDTVLILYEN